MESINAKMNEIDKYVTEVLDIYHEFTWEFSGGKNSNFHATIEYNGSEESFERILNKVYDSIWKNRNKEIT